MQAVGYSNVEARFPLVALHSRWFARLQFLLFAAVGRRNQANHLAEKPEIRGHICCCQKVEFVANPAKGNCRSAENSEGKGRSALHPPTSGGTRLKLHPLPEANPKEQNEIPRGEKPRRDAAKFGVRRELSLPPPSCAAHDPFGRVPKEENAAATSGDPMKKVRISLFSFFNANFFTPCIA